MKTYPLNSLSLDEAMKLQFKIIDCITKEFKGHQFLNRGDLGVVKGFNKPITTSKVEKVIASIFDAQSCILLRGAGSGAIRFGLHSILNCSEKILIHKAPIYSTTKTSFNMLGLKFVEANFNNLEDIKKVLKENEDIKGALIQYTRKKIDDSYNIEEVIYTIKSIKNIPIITDDNYAVMKVNKIGIQCGADLSCFSAFKLLGPEGIGIVVGKKCYIDLLVKENYSGGMQTQGYEAIDVLNGFTYAPVSLAIQSKVNEECLKRLNNGEIPKVKKSFLANAQSKVILVEFYDDIAEKVLIEAEKLGAAPNPIGAESKYEIIPMFYRVSSTFIQYDKTLEKRMIRINPMRAGADTIIRIIKEALERVK